MAHLSLSLLGPFRATLDGASLSSLVSRKALGLLAYLAVESARPHRREALAEMFWPERPSQDSLRNLRHLIFDLRKALNDDGAPVPFLLVEREALQFNLASDRSVDAAEFMTLLGTSPADESRADRLERAVALYRGAFLEGFSAGDCVAFDEWVLLQREQMAREANAALQFLAADRERRGEYGRAEAWVRRTLELEPWREESHRHLMRLLAGMGQRSAALAQYESCRKAMAEELGAEPEPETTALYRQIREGRLALGGAGPRNAYPIATADPPADPRPRLFVARERELGQLEAHLDMALAGRGHVVFVVGEAGSGKTSLLGHFARKAVQIHSDLVAAEGTSSSQVGGGDLYVPFREALQMLTADVEAKRASGSFSIEHVRRLWNLLPEALQCLLEAGPDLIDLLIPGEALASRARAMAPSGPGQSALEKLLQRRPARSRSTPFRQADLFEQVTRVLVAIAQRHPLLVLLDDLQWADVGSISLLSHLGRRLPGCRILVVGAYRPEEILHGHGGERHPLEPLVNELSRDFGDITANLDQAEGQAFVEAVLDAEPNRLDRDFRERLGRHTGGNALFTVELLEGLRERGDLVKDSEGRWVEASTLNWDRLPPRVEAVIAERVGRLSEEQQAVLWAAAVEGEEFRAEVVARAIGVDEVGVIRSLSGALARQHLLVTGGSLEWNGGSYLSRYRFRHYLVRETLYRQLDLPEQARLHAAVGQAIEDLHGEEGPGAALRLARHFEAAQMPGRAAAYLLQAGQEARVFAWAEAAARYSRGLALLELLPPTPERDRQEFSLQMALSSVSGWGTTEQLAAASRACGLARGLGSAREMLPALWTLANAMHGGGIGAEQLALEAEILRMAEEVDDPTALSLVHSSLGESLFLRGHLMEARDHLEQAIALYDQRRMSELATTIRRAVGMNSPSWLTLALWALGFPDQAGIMDAKAIALARDSKESTALGVALVVSYMYAALCRRESGAARIRAEELGRFVQENGVAMLQPWAAFSQGQTMVADRQVEGGLAQMRSAAKAEATGGRAAGRVTQLLILVDALTRSGLAEQGLELIEEAQALSDSTDLRYCEAELPRMKGEIVSSCRRPAADRYGLGNERDEANSQREAEACFLKALEIARRQAAKSWELRAATSLAQLWSRQGRRKEAQDLLASVYGWFTEGFDIPDLRDARALLHQLSDPA